jgi:GNAT superfamily N-acetyltransferase
MSLERIEGSGMRALLESSGGAGAETGGAICYALPALNAPALNHAVPVEDDVDLDAVEAWFRVLGVRWALVVTPDRTALARDAESRGYTKTRAWMKFTRDASPAPAPETTLRVEEAGRECGDDFALALAEGNGIPAGVPLTAGAATGVDGLHCFVAYADDEPAAVGVVYVDGDVAWLGAGATRPAFRRRGGQSALLAARVARALELGARTLVTETGARVDDTSHTSTTTSCAPASASSTCATTGSHRRLPRRERGRHHDAAPRG